MAQPVATVSDFLGLLARSKLMAADTVSIVGKAWKGDAGDVDGIKKLLTAGKHLTEYQAVMLQRGHADGFQVGGYVIQERIGKGASAGVYLGKHPSGQLVAVKVLSASKSKNTNTLSRFQREGRLLTQLNHPNIVRAFQIGTAKNAHFIAMEHLVGETLEEILVRRQRLPVAEACRLVVQLLDGLQHLDDHRMIHRDIKPSNLMILGGSPDSSANATLKLLDIGLGREFFEDGGPMTSDLNLTREGAILGTPDYLAPEQARDARSADIRSDIYSAGCVLYRLITGKTPFGGTNLMDQMVQHATEHAPRLSESAIDAPAALQIVMDRLLAKKAKNRFQVPRDAAEALSTFVPTASPKAEGTQVLPAYQEWLARESDPPAPVATMDTPRPTATPRPSGSFDMEMVVMPATGTHEKLTKQSRPVRRWWALTARDAIMLAIGFTLATIAIATMWFLAKR